MQPPLQTSATSVMRLASSVTELATTTVSHAMELATSRTAAVSLIVATDSLRTLRLTLAMNRASEPGRLSLNTLMRLAMRATLSHSLALQLAKSAKSLTVPT